MLMATAITVKQHLSLWSCCYHFSNCHQTRPFLSDQDIESKKKKGEMVELRQENKNGYNFQELRIWEVVAI